MMDSRELYENFACREIVSSRNILQAVELVFIPRRVLHRQTDTALCNGLRNARLVYNRAMRDFANPVGISFEEQVTSLEIAGIAIEGFHRITAVARNLLLENLDGHHKLREVVIVSPKKEDRVRAEHRFRG